MRQRPDGVDGGGNKQRQGQFYRVYGTGMAVDKIGEGGGSGKQRHGSVSKNVVDRQRKLCQRCAAIASRG